MKEKEAKNLRESRSETWKGLEEENKKGNE